MASQGSTDSTGVGISWFSPAPSSGSSLFCDLGYSYNLAERLSPHLIFEAMKERKGIYLFIHLKLFY